MSDQKVVGLDGQPVEQATEYNTDVTSLIERALADAKQFKASSVAVLLVMPTEDGFDIDIYWHGKRLSLLAAAGRLAHQLNERCDEVMEVIS
jgi:hypothetical protein